MKSWALIGSNDPQQTQGVLMLLDCCLTSLAVLVLAGAVCLGWRRASAAARHWIWFLALASLLGLPWLTFTAPLWPGPRWAVSADLDSGNRVTLAFGWAPNPGSGHSISATPAPLAGSAAVGDAVGGGAARVATQFSAGWLVAAPVIWFLGAALVLASMAAGRWRLRRMSRLARPIRNLGWDTLLEELRREFNIRRPVRLARLPGRLVPMTWGWIWPVVLLPEEADRWPAERRRMVLWHELAHVKRRDCLTQSIAELVRAVYWFNPLVWFAARRMRVERERACDDALLMGGCDASEYASHLVEIARAFRSGANAAAIAMARPSGLERRVRAILDCRRNRNRMPAMAVTALGLGIIGIGLFLGGCSVTTKRSPAPWSIERSGVEAPLKRFVVEKEAQAIAGAAAEGKEMLPEFSSMFSAAAMGDWMTISNVWEDLRQRAPQYEGSGPKDDRLHGTAWQCVLETWGAFGNIAMGGQSLVAFGQAAIQSIPSGSVYFGGTDPGRCVITALQKSHVQADPFFTLTQNALADGSYLQYLRGMYGASIQIPTDEDNQRCFARYLEDAQRRLNENQLKPGEQVNLVDGRVQVSGQVAVMSINALLAKIIFDANPHREFYVEESFPLDWMYPHLSPNGPIMKLNRQPLAELGEEIIRQDREYWTLALQLMIGDWLEYDTPLRKVTAFAGRAYPKPPPQDSYVRNDAAQKWASKLRSSIAGLYAWRMAHSNDEVEKRRMSREADYAFRQAFALCPYSPEAVFRYVKLLVDERRFEDAVLVAKTALNLVPESAQFRDLMREIDRAATSRP